MAPQRVTKQIVCSDCGRPIHALTPTAADLERTAPVSDDDVDEPAAVELSPQVEVVVEIGPVCSRCANFR
ncbi:MAG TPA: hypothetical protein VLH79_09650 [Chthonomonadales bacterium]|nr:hypothetical protein [Chthonomonadales bacterium]